MFDSHILTKFHKKTCTQPLTPFRPNSQPSMYRRKTSSHDDMHHACTCVTNSKALKVFIAQPWRDWTNKKDKSTSITHIEWHQHSVDDINYSESDFELFLYDTAHRSWDTTCLTRRYGRIGFFVAAEQQTSCPYCIGNVPDTIRAQLCLWGYRQTFAFVIVTLYRRGGK